MKLYCNTASIGEKQSGKTYHAIETLQENKNTLRIFINTKLEQKYYRNFRFIVNSIEEFVHYVFRDVNEKGLNNHYIYCFNPPPREKGNKTFIKFVDGVYDMIVNGTIPYPTILCVDEVRNYKGDALKSINNIALKGEGFGLLLYSVSQRVQHFPTDIRENTDCWFMSQTKDTQLEFLSQNGIIQFPDSMRRKNRDGVLYEHKFDLWDSFKDRKIYVQEPMQPLKVLQ